MSPSIALLLVLGAYLLGSVPFGYLVARAKGLDIRTVGSGNIGMTNVWRNLGWPYGVTVLALDVAKGYLPVWLALRLPGAASVGAGSGLTAWAPVLVGLAAVLGHMFPVYLRFRGGKGVATGAGVMGALAPAAAGVAILVFLVTVGLSRYVSLGSLLASASLPVSIGLLAYRDADAGGDPGAWWPTFMLALVGAIAVWWAHRSNIRRLLAGQESRVGREKPLRDPGVGEA